MSETRILRRRHADRIAEMGRLVSPDPTGTLKFLGTVVSGGSIPTAADKYCLVNPTEIGGSETEGGAVSLTADTSIQIPGLVLGVAPVVGDKLVFTSVNGRWVARKRTSGGGGPPPIITGCSFPCGLTFAGIVGHTFTFNGSFYADLGIVGGPYNLTMSVPLVPNHYVVTDPSTGHPATQPRWSSGILDSPRPWYWNHSQAEATPFGGEYYDEFRGAKFSVDMFCGIGGQGFLYGPTGTIQLVGSQSSTVTSSSCSPDPNANVAFCFAAGCNWGGNVTY